MMSAASAVFGSVSSRMSSAGWPAIPWLVALTTIAAPAWRANAGPIVVLGAGGGARAVCYGLLQEGAKKIRLVNRTLARANGIAAEFGSAIEVLRWEDRHEALEGVAMAVNATSQGMSGQSALDIRLDKLPKTALAADIIYVPLETPFLAAARKRGNPTLNGLGMLLHQGRPAWKAWFGIEPEVTEELRGLMERSLEPEAQPQSSLARK